MHISRFRAITTRYKGYAFRSRLEARWAVFFDSLGIRWDYEPEGFELGNGLRYLPDFWLPDWKMWVEVKPGEPDDVTREKAFRLAIHSGAAVFVTCGMPDASGTLCVTHTQQGGEVGMHDLSAVVAWAPRPVILALDENLLSHVGQFDQTLPVPVLGRHRRVREDAVLRFAVDDFQPALEAARGARFEFGEKGAA